MTVLALLIASLAAALLMPSAAHAGVITKNWRVQPMGTVTSAGPIIVNGGGSFDAYPLAIATLELRVDGAVVPRGDYVATTPFTRNLYLYYAPSPVLADGSHTFRVQIADTLGRLSAYQWSATVAQAPTASWLSPASGAVDFDGRPAITLSVSDNTPATTLAVAGEVRAGSATGAVAATFGGTGLAAGSHDFALAGELVPGTYYLTASVTDAAGNVRTLAGSAARRFTVVSAPVMTLAPSGCMDAGCHVATSHPATGMACSSCHVAVYHEYAECQDCHGGHNGPVTVTGIFGKCTTCHSPAQPTVPVHTPAGVGPAHASSCAECHNESLLDRHSFTPEGSLYATQCDLCHASTDPLVVAAIAAGDASCSACHDREESHGNLSAIHESTTTSASIVVMSGQVGIHPPSSSDIYACSMCHATKNLLTLHGAGWNNCALCHASGAPRSTFDTWNKGCQQGGCHSVLHNQVDADREHAATMVNGARCYYCHNGEGEDFAYERQNCAGRCHGVIPAVGDALAPVTSVTNAAAYFKAPAQVRLTATDAGSSVTGTYYRIDGGEWRYSPGSQTTASVPAGGAGLLEFYSVDWFGNAEEPGSYQVTFDLEAPVTTDDGATHPVDYPWRLSVSDVGSGVAATYYSFDGRGFAQYGYFENLLGIRGDTNGGVHTLSYYSVDAVGNAESVVTVNYVIPDPDAPTSYLSTTDGRSATIMAQDYYSGTASGVRAIYYRLDDGDWGETVFPPGQPYTGGRVADIVVPGDGAYQLEYYAVDWAGNEEAHRTTTLTIDSVNPTITVNAADSYTGSASIAAAGVDGGSGVASITYRIDSYSPTTVTGSGTTIFLPAPLSGSRTFVVSAWATDRVGNQSAVFGPKTIVVYPTPDSTPPTTSLRQYAAPRALVTEGSRFSCDTPPMKFRFSAQDNTSGIGSMNYKIDAGAWQSTAGHSQLTYLDVLVDLGLGTHTVSYYAVDGAGNAEGTRTVTFTVEPGSLTFFFTMSNLLYADGMEGWSDDNYAYDVNIYKAGQLVGTTYHQTTWDTAGTPAYVYPYNFVSFQGAGVGPYDVELVLHTKNRGDQTFWWYEFDDAAPGEIWLSEGYYDVVDWLELESDVPVTTASESDGDTIESDTGEFVVDLLATDAGTGVAATYYKVDDGDWQVGAPSGLSVELLGYGTHTIAFYSVDHAGNTEVTQSISLTIVAPPMVRFHMTNVGSTNPSIAC